MKKRLSKSNGVLVVLSAAIALAGFALAYKFIGPPPPKTLTIATGSASGAYYRFAEQYAAFLGANGITLNIVQTSGSVDNLARLRDADSEIDVAFVQGGVGDPENDQDLLSLASLYHEPLWIFHRCTPAPSTLGDLAPLKISIGSKGSGTYATVEDLLTQNGLTPDGPGILPWPMMSLRNSSARARSIWHSWSRASAHHWCSGYCLIPTFNCSASTAPMPTPASAATST